MMLRAFVAAAEGEGRQRAEQVSIESPPSDNTRPFACHRGKGTVRDPSARPPPYACVWHVHTLAEMSRLPVHVCVCEGGVCGVRCARSVCVVGCVWGVVCGVGVAGSNAVCRCGGGV